MRMSASEQGGGVEGGELAEQVADRQPQAGRAGLQPHEADDLQDQDAVVSG
jgi:hypothetical protein